MPTLQPVLPERDLPVYATPLILSGFTSLGLNTAARAATGFTTKAAARAAVDALVASPAAKDAAKKASTVYVRIKRAGFDGYQVVETVIKSDGTKEVVQKAYDASGRLVHYDPK